MYCQMDMPRDRQFLESRKHLKCAVDGQWYDREIKFHGKAVGPALERAHLAGPCPRTFGKNHKRHSSTQQALGPLHCAASGGRRLIVDKNLLCPAACPPDKWNFLKTLLHHPAEIMAEIAVDSKNVVSPLMVGYEHIADL